MIFDLKVECTHREIDLQKNIEMDFVENINNFEGMIAAVFRCPVCNREAVVSMEAKQ